MEDLKLYLSKNKIFTKKELETLCESNINDCNMCLKKCGSIIKLNQCNKDTKICFECLDSLHDNYNIENNNKELFKCLCCNNNIYDYTFI